MRLIFTLPILILGKETYGHVYVLFLKTVLCSQKQGEQEKHGKHVWFPVSFFFLNNIKTQKTLNLKNKEEFSKNTFLVFFVFSKTVLKNCFQKQEPNRPFVSFLISF